MQTVLVTGAGGFVGDHVVQALLAEGFAVRGLDLSFPAEAAKAERVTGSVLDAATLEAAMEGCGAVVHAAANAHLWARDPADFDRINVVGARLVAAAASARRARMVHVSSFIVLVSGPDRPARTLDETAEIAPEDLLGPYPRSKRRAELAVLEQAGLGLDAVIVLPASPVGPGDHRLTAPSRMLLDLSLGKLPAFLDCRINLVDVRALAGGIVAALKHGRGGERYLLSGEDWRFSDIANAVESETGVPAPKARAPYRIAWLAAFIEAGVSRLTKRPPNAPLTGVRLAGREVTFSNAKARAELGFNPPPPEPAIREALAWMKRAGLR